MEFGFWLIQIYFGFSKFWKCNFPIDFASTGNVFRSKSIGVQWFPPVGNTHLLILDCVSAAHKSSYFLSSETEMLLYLSRYIEKNLWNTEKYIHEYREIQTNLDCNYTSPIDLTLNEILFGTKWKGKV